MVAMCYVMFLYLPVGIPEGRPLHSLGRTVSQSVLPSMPDLLDYLERGWSISPWARRRYLTIPFRFLRACPTRIVSHGLLEIFGSATDSDHRAGDFDVGPGSESQLNCNRVDKSQIRARVRESVPLRCPADEHRSVGTRVRHRIDPATRRIPAVLTSDSRSASKRNRPRSKLRRSSVRASVLCTIVCHR